MELIDHHHHHHELLMIINHDVALAIARRLAEMARKHQLNQCINSCTSCTTVCIMAASLLMCSGPGRLADRSVTSVHEDGHPYMSGGFKQKALQLLVMAVNQGLLDEKSFETHKNMVQIVGGRCIRIYQIRRPQEPAPVAAVAASLGDMICGTGTSQPQPLPTVLMSFSTEPGSPGSSELRTVPQLRNCQLSRFYARLLRLLHWHRIVHGPDGPEALDQWPRKRVHELGLPRCWRLESRSCVSGLVCSFIVGRSAPSLV